MRRLCMVLVLISASMLWQGALCTGEEAAGQEQEKISFDIKGMDIVDVLKMLAERSGMDLAIGKNVQGKVTLFLNEVSVQDAFDIVILSSELAYDERGGIINVMTQRDYELQYGRRFEDKKSVLVFPVLYVKAQELAKTLNQMKSAVGKVIADESTNTIVIYDSREAVAEMGEFIEKADMPVDTRIYALDYASAEDISARLAEIITAGVGSVSVDARTNKIVVTDYAHRFETVEKIIEAFDEETPQVLIDAQIIEVRPSDKFEMGVDWDYWIRKHFRISQDLALGTSNRLILGALNAEPAERGEYKAVLDLLRTIGDTKILSSPRIMALNNEEARILVGTKDAYITSNISQTGETAITSQTVNFVDVGIKLYVTPRVNRKGMVTMNIRPEVSSAERVSLLSEGQETQIPIVTTSEAETTIMVQDGVTVIIGGLRQDEHTKTVKKIPVLGDIPLLGYFFRSTSDAVTQTELVILLTPYIMDATRSYTDTALMRPKDGMVVKMENGEIVRERVFPTKGATGREKGETGH